MLGEWTCPDFHCGHTSKNKKEGEAAQVETEGAIGQAGQDEDETQMRNRYLHRRRSQ